MSGVRRARLALLAAMTLAAAATVSPARSGSSGRTAACSCAAPTAVVVVTTPPDGPERPSPAGFAMATGVLAVSPSTGLSDGQAVTVSGTDLMPTYDGPAWWIFQTGEWAMGQCGAGILSDVSVAGVFRHCTVPPGAGAVTVTGSSATRTVEAQATIQPPIGGPVDCTAGAEACVVILTRIEEDGQVTLHHAPLAFA